MERIIKSMEEKYLLPALELVEAVFTASECAENGKLVYEVSFNAGGYDYDYDIDAYTGKVIRSEKERDD